MKILTLIIKQKYFDQIISGEKTHEYRQTAPHTEKKFLKLDEENGYIYMPDDKLAATEKPVPRQYDARRFYVGYHTDRDSALVRVKSVRSDWILDKDGKAIVMGLDENFEEIEGEYFWLPLTIDYELGEIIEKKVKPKK